MKISKAQRQRIRGLSAEVIKAQRAAVEAIAAELERRRQPAAPLEWDASIFDALRDMPPLEFEPVDLSGLLEDVDLSGLFDDPPGTPGPPVFIPISDD